MKNENMNQADEKSGQETVGSQSFAAVLEVNVKTLPQDLQYALVQILDTPKVFTRAEFLKSVATMERTFAGISFEALRNLPVNDFDYLALVNEIPAARSGRVLLDLKRTHLESLKSLLDGTDSFIKIKRDRLAKHLAEATLGAS